MSQPDAIVVGAPRCGTTSLHHVLGHHPDLWVPSVKEVQYFALPELREARGPGDQLGYPHAPQSERAYRALFQPKADRMAVEFSPAYFPHSQAASRVAQKLGPVKVILLLRHPVAKAYSQYCHLSRRHLETLSFAHALDAEAGRAADGWGDMWQYRRGMQFAPLVEQWLREFGPERVHVIFAEQWFESPTRTVKNCLEFLGVSPYPLPRAHLGRGGYPRRRWVARLGGPDRPPLRWLNKGSPGAVRWVRRSLEDWNTGPAPPLDPELAKILWEETTVDREQLAALLGRPLPWTGPIP